MNRRSFIQRAVAAVSVVALGQVRGDVEVEAEAPRSIWTHINRWDLGSEPGSLVPVYFNDAGEIRVWEARA